jgi:hypothetical protein
MAENSQGKGNMEDVWDGIDNAVKPSLGSEISNTGETSPETKA